MCLTWPRCVQGIVEFIGDILGILCEWSLAMGPEPNIFMSSTDLAVTPSQVPVRESADLLSSGKLGDGTRDNCETRLCLPGVAEEESQYHHLHHVRETAILPVTRACVCMGVTPAHRPDRSLNMAERTRPKSRVNILCAPPCDQSAYFLSLLIFCCVVPEDHTLRIIYNLGTEIIMVE